MLASSILKQRTKVLQNTQSLWSIHNKGNLKDTMCAVLALS